MVILAVFHEQRDLPARVRERLQGVQEELDN